MVAFEAAVAGGIPIIKSLREGLTANRIEWIAGIINGTSNFILSEMREKGLPFETVLAEAQRLGYAEADPTFDIEGIDAAHKLTIMSAIAFGIPMQFERAYTEGIAKLTKDDIRYAEQLGYRIKLLGITRRTPAGIELRVHPTLIPAKRLIANVEGVMNAVLVKGDAVGATLYYGAGAGAEPTASAVIADLVDVTRMAHRRSRATACPISPSSPTSCPTRRSCRWTRSRPRTTCGCACTTVPACSPTSRASWPTTRSRSTRWSRRNPPRARTRSTSCCSRTARSRSTRTPPSPGSRRCRASPAR
jgi:hypothetical protein